MELKGTEEDIINNLIRGLLEYGVDNNMASVDIQSAMNNAGIIASIEEIDDFVEIITEHRRACPKCGNHGSADDEEHPLPGASHGVLH